MLQSEFYERTHITLTGEEYADVEFLYMNVEMNKDEFCKQWLKNRSNKLFQQISDVYVKDMKRKNDDVDRLYEENQMLKAQLEEKDRVHEDILSETLKKKNAEFFDVGYVEDFEDFGEDLFYGRNAYEILLADFLVA